MTHSDEEMPEGANAATAEDALELLRNDHRTIDGLLELLTTEGRGASDRHGLLSRLGALLRAHARIEDEIFYPALADRVEAGALRQAEAEHAQIATLLEALAAVDPSRSGFDARALALAEAVRRHVTTEENQLMPRSAGLDLQELGDRLARRRAVLLTDLAVD